LRTPSLDHPYIWLNIKTNTKKLTSGMSFIVYWDINILRVVKWFHLKMKTRFALVPCSGNEAEKWSEQDFIFHNVCKVSLYWSKWPRSESAVSTLFHGIRFHEGKSWTKGPIKWSNSFLSWLEIKTETRASQMKLYFL
jgi:hypothetical protein